MTKAYLSTLLAGTSSFRRETGAPGEIRTPDLMLRRHSLYPAELRARSIRIPHFEVSYAPTTGPLTR